MLNLTPDEEQAVALVLRSSVVQNAIGAEEWDLTEDEENLLWGVINRLEKDDG